MSSPSAIIIPAGDGQKRFVLGDIVTIKIRNEETGGIYSQIETTCGPQVGPPMHVHHREDETFYVIEGEFEFHCAGEVTTGGPGTIVRLPRDVPHRFKNISNATGRVLVTMTPGGFEGFFDALGELTADEQEDILRVAEIAAQFGLEFLPPE